MGRKESRKAQVLVGIASFLANNGYPPTYRDLAEYVGVAHSLIHGYVKELRADGLINEGDPKVSRALTLTAAGVAAAYSPLERRDAEPVH